MSISKNVNKLLQGELQKALEKGLNNVGYLVEGKAKENVGVATGILRASISNKVEDNVCYIGSNVEYAPYHHSKNPFLEDAIQENMTEILAQFKGVL